MSSINKYKNEYQYDDYEVNVFKVKYILEQHANIAGMGEIVVSSKDKPIIGTTALDTCFGIVLYDRKNKKGIVGHAAPSSRISTLIDMINLLEKDQQQVIEYAIISGYRNDEKHDYSGQEELLNYLENHCPQNIKLIPFSDLRVQVCSNVLAYEFAFEVNTGKSVSNYLFYEGEEPFRKYK